ncbi:MAG TPA: hypothetical protein VJQ55_09290 [Candidatus Binatia bacterium]|nr:hypothetical protein [Candidatus Binatia bacterium]
MLILFFVLAFSCLSGEFSSLQAQHVIVLKNGRQITVQSYREEGSMIKFNGLGGEIGLPKDQVQTILKAGQSNRPGVNISDLETSASAPAKVPPKTSTPSAGSPPPRSGGGQEPKPAVTANDEAKTYQKRLAELNQSLDKANRAYFEATQGGGTGSNLSREGLRAWTEDLASRIYDSQKVPGGGGASSTPPTPPYEPVYTPKQKELSDLRAQIDRLNKERDALIEEMKSKNIPTF